MRTRLTGGRRRRWHLWLWLWLWSSDKDAFKQESSIVPTPKILQLTAFLEGGTNKHAVYINPLVVVDAVLWISCTLMETHHI